METPKAINLSVLAMDNDLRAGLPSTGIFLSGRREERMQRRPG
jgi:hypothetical protein